jgi:hypothetical protein
MSPRDTRPPIPDVRLERYRLGELPAAERESITARLADDPGLRERLARLDRSDAEIASAYPTQTLTQMIRRRALQPETAGQASAVPRRSWLVPAAVMAACACVAAIAVTIWQHAPVADDTTIKSGRDASLVLHRRVADGSEELRRGAPARQGDEVRIGYRAAGRRYGAILSIDGRGTLTQHLPRAGDQAAPLRPTGTVLLDFAYELDDAPRYETFYFVTANEPFALEPVRRAVRAAGAGTAPPGALALQAGLTQFLFPLTKDQR